MLAGGLAGFTFSAWLLVFFSAAIEAYIPRGLFTAFFCLLGSCGIFLLQEPIILAFSVFAGANVFMFGLDHFFDFGFKKAVVELVNKEDDKQLQSIPWVFWVTLGIALFGGVVQWYYQYRSSSSSSSKSCKSLKRTESRCDSCGRCGSCGRE